MIILRNKLSPTIKQKEFGLQKSINRLMRNTGAQRLRKFREGEGYVIKTKNIEPDPFKLIDESIEYKIIPANKVHKQKDRDAIVRRVLETLKKRYPKGGEPKDIRNILPEGANYYAI